MRRRQSTSFRDTSGLAVGDAIPAEAENPLAFRQDHSTGTTVLLELAPPAAWNSACHNSSRR